MRKAVDSKKKYQKALRSLEKRYGEAKEKAGVRELTSLLQSITGELVEDMPSF